MRKTPNGGCALDGTDGTAIANGSCLIDTTKSNGKYHHHKNENGAAATAAAAAAITSPKKSMASERPSGASKLKKLAECLLGLSVPLWSTVSLQANETNCRTSVLIASTMAIYGIMYAILRHYKGFLQPASSSWLVAAAAAKKKKSDGGDGDDDGKQNCDDAAIAAATAAAAEWRSRFLAIINALILIVGSALCFTEWVSTYEPASEGWVKTLPLECSNSSKDNTCSCFTSYPLTFASLFVGYLQWDLCWLIWHRDTHYDVGSMIHHSVFIAVTQFVLLETYFRKPFAWLSFTELSTPFLHLRWILAATGMKENRLYFLASLGFALTFLSTRAVGYGLGLIDVWRNRESWGKIPGLWAVVGGLHLGYLLNLFWSIKVGSALVRTVFKRTKKEKPRQKME